MEQIRQAVERAKSGAGTAELTNARNSALPQRQTGPTRSPLFRPAAEIELDSEHLEAHRIIAHKTADPRSRAFDMLRTQVLQSMEQKKLQILAITSPTPECGKTVTAINLALSIARLPERPVLLVDMDLPRPQIANYLGITCHAGLVDVFERRATLADAMVHARINSCEVAVLPTESPTIGSSELISSRAMSTILQDIRRDYNSATVLLDMPPMLSSADVISILPHIDGVLLVAAVGITTVSEIKECNRHLQGTEVVRLVMNKEPGPITRYYY